MSIFKNLFQRIPIAELISDSLYDAERELLKAQDGLEYAQAMVKYRMQQVKRLRSEGTKLYVQEPPKSNSETLTFPKLDG